MGPCVALQHPADDSGHGMLLDDMSTAEAVMASCSYTPSKRAKAHHAGCLEALWVGKEAPLPEDVAQFQGP